MYQYTHGAKTQQGLSEMFYTFYVTSISTIITTAITLGIGAAAKALDAWIPSISFMGPGSNILTQEVAKKTILTVLAKYATLSSWQTLKLLLSPITETLQEIFVDPYLETIVTKIVGDLGGDVFWQVLASSLVEGGRESLTGPMSTFLFGNQQQNPNTQVNDQHIFNEIQSESDQLQNNIEQTEKLRSVKIKWSSVLKTGASLLLGTAMIGLGGPMFFGASLTMGFSALSSSIKSFEFRKNVVRRTALPPVGEIVPDQTTDTTTWSTMESIKDLVTESKISPVPKSSVKNPKRPLFERTAIWMRSLKKTGVTAAIAPIGAALISPMMLLVGLGISGAYLGISAMVKKVNSESRFLVKSHEISLTEYAKNLIEEFGFIPMGGLILPDGRKTWENVESEDTSVENMDIEKYLDHLISIDSKYAKIVKPLKDNLKDGYSIENQQQLKQLINKINRERTTSGKSKLWGIVYRITNKDGLQRVGETESETNFLFIDRLMSYLNKAKKVLDSKTKLNAFESDLADYFEFSKGKNLKEQRNTLINEFFNGYKVEIWLCDSALEMHALEDLITLYSNRIDNEQGFDLKKNKHFNSIVGNLIESVKMEQAIKIQKCIPLFPVCFEQALNKEEAIKFFKEKVDFDITETTLDVYCRKLYGNNYYQTQKEYNVYNSRIKQETDSSNFHYYNLKNTQREDLLWIQKDKDGNTLRLNYGYFNDLESGKGLEFSFNCYKDRFNGLYLFTTKQFSELALKTIKEGQYRKIAEGEYIYKVELNNLPEYFRIKVEYDNNILKTGKIIDIYPYRSIEGKSVFLKAKYLGE